MALPARGRHGLMRSADSRIAKVMSAMATRSTPWAIVSLVAFTSVVVAKPKVERLEIATDKVHVDRVDRVDGTVRSASQAVVDTIWIADWTFDSSGSACDDTGWTKVDNRILNDGQVYWDGDDNRFDGVGEFRIKLPF